MQSQHTPVLLLVLLAGSISHAQRVTLESGTALRIELNHRVRSRVGATVQGHLIQPIYLKDHEVVPAGSLVSGSIQGMHNAPKGDRVRRLLAADFTPPRVPELRFDTLTLPEGRGVLSIDALGIRTDASVVTLGTTKKKQSIAAQVRGAIVKAKNDAVASLKHHEVTEAVEKYAIGQLPYHPEIIWSKTRFNADLASPVTLPDVSHPNLLTEDLHGRLPTGTLHARLLSSVTSEIAKRGDPVEAIITQPLLSSDGTRLLVPEGTHLHGVVVKTKAARSFGRNGDLRFTFRNLDLPTESGNVLTTEVHGRLSGAETAPGQHVTLDEEGEAKATDGPGKYAEPLILGVLASVATPDDHHHGSGDGIGPGAQTVSSNGFGLIARVVALSTQNTQVLEGFAYYSLGKSIYFNFVAKGHDTTFPHDTEIEVTLSER